MRVFLVALFAALGLSGCGGGAELESAPPVISNGQPTGTLLAGTTQATMSVTTNEDAACKWGTSSGTSYAAMSNTFTTTGGTSHSTLLTGLVDGQSYTRYVRCQDGAGDTNTSSFTVSFSVAGPPDTTPPVISNGQPTGTLSAGTTQATMRVTSNESATCKWDTSSGTSYAAMPNTFTTTGGTSHSTLLTGLVDGQSYTRYVRCQDGAGNANTSSFTVSFSVGTGAGPITVSLVASRASGVAPLAVFFDAAGTTSTGTARPFHDLEYQWDFDDLGSGTWSRGSRPAVSSKNSATGPVAAHVYETAGTYTVTLTVTDGTNTAISAATIVVTAADTQWSGTATLCVDNGATPVAGLDGCPSGAAVLNSGDFDSIINTSAGGGATRQRILLRKGKTFTASTTASITADGPGLLGSYGASGAKPIIAGAPSDKIGLGSMTNNNFGDWRIMDLQLSGSGGIGNAIAHAGTSTSVTIMRCDIDAATNGIIFDLNVLDAHNNPTRVQDLYSELAIVENDISNSDLYGIFGAAKKFMVLGNRITNSINEHGMRSQYSRLSVVSNNEFGVAGRTSLTMRGVFHFTANRTGGNSTGRYTLDDAVYTELGVVSDNKFVGGTGTIPFTLKSVNSFEDARFRNHIVERNVMVLGTNGLQPFFQTESSELTIRNNLVDTTSAALAQIAFALSKSTGTPSPADGIYVYNNTHFSNRTIADAFLILDAFSGSSPTNVKAKNNLGYAPNNTGFSTNAVRGPLGAGDEVSNNSSTAQILGTNPFAVAAPNPNVPAQWTPGPGSYAIDSGTAVPVWSDFFAASRAGTYDLGGVNP